MLSSDQTILSLLGLTGKPQNEIPKRIIKRSSYDGLTTGERRLCIYHRPARRAANPLVSEQVLQVDCHVPAVEDYIAMRVIKRVHELLHNKEIGGHLFSYDGYLGELPTASGFYCAGIRFTYQNIV